MMRELEEERKGRNYSIARGRENEGGRGLAARCESRRGYLRMKEVWMGTMGKKTEELRGRLSEGRTSKKATGESGKGRQDGWSDWAGVLRQSNADQ